MKNRNYKNQAVPLSMGVFDLLSGNQKNGEAMNNRSGSKGTGLSVIEEKQESPRPLHSKGSNSVMKAGSRSASRSRPFGKTGLNSNGVSYSNDRQDSSDDNVDTRQTKTVTFKSDVESLGRNSSSSDDSNGSGWSNKGGNSSATESEYSTTSEYSPRNESKAEDKPSYNNDIMSSTTNTSSYGSSNNSNNNNNTTSSTGSSNNNNNASSTQGLNNNSSSLGSTNNNSTSLPSSDNSNSNNSNNNTSSNNNSTSSGQNNNTSTYASSSISTSSTGSRDGRSTPSGSSVSNASERGTYNQRTGSYTRDQGTGTDTNIARSGTPARTRTPTAQSAYAPPKSQSYSTPSTGGGHHHRTNSNQPNSYGSNDRNWNNNNNNNNNNRGGNDFRNPQRSNTWDSRDSGDWSRPEQKAYDQGVRIAEDELKNMSLSEVRNHSPRNSGNFTTGYNDRNNNQWDRDHSPQRGGWSNNDRSGYGNDRGYNNRDNYNDRGGGYGNSDRGYGNIERGYNDRNDYSNDRRGGGGWNDRGGNRDRYDRGRGNNYSPPSPPPKKSGFDADRKMDVAYEAGYKDALERVKADMMRQFGGGNNSRNTNNRW